jgi:hypothetical protein
MLTRPNHLFDEATRVVAGDSRWQGRTSPDYWAFVGPFGGATAASMLRALIEHPERAGDPLSMTVNYCALIAEGEFDLDIRLVKANRSSQHWCVGSRKAATTSRRLRPPCLPIAGPPGRTRQPNSRKSCRSRGSFPIGRSPPPG